MIFRKSDRIFRYLRVIMLRFIISIFLAWLLYKLVFDLIIPGYRVTKQVRRQMNDMQDHMRQQYEQQNGGPQGENRLPLLSPKAWTREITSILKKLNKKKGRCITGLFL